eukprot:TRINITY_DN8038_c0_g1_i2.p1 TRINITY_DN8038_c0_g1~~TRINITY_DN8038_c0_g1_i2.p1  ORF type:complete len:987 (+),score=133.23 TRINITY_DN8038_c0_g1_i2:74-3034(+)
MHAYNGAGLPSLSASSTNIHSFESQDYGDFKALALSRNIKLPALKKQESCFSISTSSYSDSEEEEENNLAPFSTYGYTVNEKDGEYSKAVELLKAIKSQKTSVCYDFISEITAEQLIILQKKFSSKGALAMCEFISILEELLEFNQVERVPGQNTQIVLRQLLSLYEQINIRQSEKITWSDFCDFFTCKTSRARSETNDMPSDITRYQSQPKVLLTGEHIAEKLVYVPEVQKLITCDRSKIACIRELSTGKVVKELIGHNGPVVTGAFIPKMDMYVTSSVDNTIGCWDVGGVRSKPIESEYPQLCFHWFDSMDLLLSGDTRGTIRFWDLKDRSACRAPVAAHSDWVMDIKYITDYGLLATASLDRSIKIWDPKGFTPVITHASHSLGVTSMSYSSFATLLFSCGSERDIYAWHPTKRGLVHRMKGHEKGTVGVFCKEGSPELISADITGCIKIWDIRRFSCVQTLNPTCNSEEEVESMKISSLSFDEDHRQIITGGERIQLWKPIQDRSNDMTSFNPITAVSYLNYQAYKSFVVASGDEISVWDAHSGVLEHTFKCHEEISRILILERKILVGTSQGNLEIYNISTGGIINSIKVLAEEVYHLLSTGKRHFLIGNATGKANVYAYSNFTEMTQKFALAIPFKSTPFLKCCPKHKVIAVGGDRTIMLFRADSGVPIASAELDSPISSIAFSASLPALITVDRMSLRLWTVGNASPIMRIDLRSVLTPLFSSREKSTPATVFDISEYSDSFHTASSAPLLSESPSFILTDAKHALHPSAVTKRGVCKRKQDFSPVLSINVADLSLYLVIELVENYTIVLDMQKILFAYYISRRAGYDLERSKIPSEKEIDTIISENLGCEYKKLLDLPKYLHIHNSVSELTIQSAEELVVQHFLFKTPSEVRVSPMAVVDDPFVVVTGCTEGRVRLWNIEGELIGKFAKNGDSQWTYRPMEKKGTRLPYTGPLYSSEEDDSMESMDEYEGSPTKAFFL